MAKLTIGDKTVTVDDSFRNMTPEQQSAAVEEIASSLGLGAAPQGEEVGTPDPEIAKYTGEVLSGDPSRARAAVVQNEYEQMPWYKKPLVAADDIARLTADGVTAGFTDKIGGALSGVTGIGPSTDERRQNTEDARSRAGWAGTTAEVAGGIYGAGKFVKGGEAAAKVAGQVLPRAAELGGKIANATGVVGRTAGVAAGGAAYGAVDAAGHDRDIGTGALIGAGAGVGGKILGEVASKTASKVAGAFNKAPKIMAREELEAAGRQAYKAADDAGVILKPQATQRLSQELKDDLAEFGYMPELQPKVGSFLAALDRTAGENVTLKGVDQLRKVAGLMGKSGDGSEREIARQIVKKIDKHLESLKDTDLLMGNKVGGVRALQNARKLWASTKKSEMIENAIEKATNNAAGSGSGGNFDNALRQQFRSILNDPKKARGLTKDERAAMQLIVRGVKGEKLLRTVSKLSPNGNGLMAMLGLGSAAAFGPAGLGASAAGIGAKAVTDRLTPARVEQLSRIVRAGGDASATKAQKNLAQKLIEQYGERLQLPLAVGGVLATD